MGFTLAALAACIKEEKPAVEEAAENDPVVTDTGSTDTDTATAGDTGVDTGNAYAGSAPRGTYANAVVTVDNYTELMEQMDNVLQPGHHALVDISAYWCGPCQSWKPLYEYLADFDDGQHLWVLAEDQEGEPETSYDIWDNWTQPGAVDATMASCWGADYYYPQLYIVEKATDGSLTAHETENRGYFFAVTDEETSETYTYTDGTVLIFNGDRASNELYQVEDGAHIYDTSSGSNVHAAPKAPLHPVFLNPEFSERVQKPVELERE